MSSTFTLPLTPMRKRAISLEHAALHDTFIKQETSPDTSHTPGPQDVPELDWVETPEQGESFPCTPSPINTLRKVLPIDAKLHKLHVGDSGETSSSKLLKALKSTKVKRISSVESHLPGPRDIELAKGILFPLHLSTPSPAQETEDTRLYRFMGDISPENLRFLSPFDSPPNFSKPNDQSLAALRFAIQNPKHYVRSPLQKRVRVGNERPRESIDLQTKASNTDLSSGAAPFEKRNITVRPPLLRQAPIKAQVISHSRASGHSRTNPKLTGSTNRRFTRILDLDSIERLIENHMICIASLAKSPSVRCSMQIVSTDEAKDQILNQISELKDPLDLTVCESYIRGLIDSFTCQRYHHRIATEQLGALFDRYHDRRARKPNKVNDFTQDNLASLPIWLAALTRLPGEQTIQGVHIASQTYQSKSSASVQTSTNTVFVKPETSELRQTTSVTQRIKKGFPDLKTTFNALHRVHASSKFISTQIIDIDFLKNAIRTPKTTSLNEERAKISFVKSVNALEQEFSWHFPSLNYSAEHHIRECINKTLTMTEKDKKGYIYMYWIVGSFDFVKIGHTYKSSSTRLKEWERQCGHKILEFTATEVAPKVLLPCVSRVEALVHAELREARLREPTCKRCSERAKKNKGHIEWFAVSAAHAQRVINKWSNWMLTIPYEAAKLKDDINAADIDKLCKPLPLSVRDTAAFAALRPLTQTEPLLPLLTAPRARNLRQTKARQLRMKSAEDRRQARGGSEGLRET